MYLITYQKRNGTVFCRIRNTIPNCGVGHYTSMGWKILDVKYRFKNDFYNLLECRKLEDKYYKKNHIIKNIGKFFQKYSTTLFFITLIFLIK